MSKGPNHRRKNALDALAKLPQTRARNNEIDKIEEKLKRRGEWKWKTKRRTSASAARSKSKKGK